MRSRKLCRASLPVSQGTKRTLEARCNVQPGAALAIGWGRNGHRTAEGAGEHGHCATTFWSFDLVGSLQAEAAAFEERQRRLNV